MSFQTMTFFLCVKKKNRIIWREKKVNTVKLMGFNVVLDKNKWNKYLFCVKKKLIQVWNDIRVN